MKVEVFTQDDYKVLVDRLDRLERRINEAKETSKPIELYTNSDLVKLLKVSSRCLQNWRDQGLIDFCQIRSKIYYPGDDVRRFIANNKFKHFNII
ncbi:helix-turn-helix domain-containing protein [Spirosoma sp. BT702]|uniref:Helix-turn-helix domain-containing protein n=2 Tax=Spirosoma profusum TaxID=2771354 RepID=A0A926XWK5_9BACT|nr:helix-turn-helix domain-containing protein [Spirosoma profusum]